MHTESPVGGNAPHDRDLRNARPRSVRQGRRAPSAAKLVSKRFGPSSARGKRCRSWPRCSAIGGLGWYLLQPPSADQLYGQIEQAIDPADSKTILEAREPLAEFLRLYPDDPRAAVVQGYLDQAEELRAQRRQDLKNRPLNRPAIARTPLERAYREALFYKVPDPEQALARFQALLDLYGRDPTAEDNEWLELARKEVALLTGQLAEDHAKDLAAIGAQLAEADGQRAGDPAAAAKNLSGDYDPVCRQALGRRAGRRGPRTALAGITGWAGTDR